VGLHGVVLARTGGGILCHRRGGQCQFPVVRCQGVRSALGHEKEAINTLPPTSCRPFCTHNRNNVAVRQRLHDQELLPLVILVFFVTRSSPPSLMPPVLR